MCSITLRPQSRMFFSALVATAISVGLFLSFHSLGHAMNNTAQPSLATGIETAPVSGTLKLVGQLGGVTNAIDFSGQYMYMGLGARLAVYDVSDAANPVLITVGADLPGIVEDLQVAGQYLYVALGKEGLLIFDLADPTSPVEISHVSLNGYSTSLAKGVIVSGTLAFVRGNFIAVFDISAPQNPRFVREIFLQQGPVNFALNGNHLWLTHKNAFNNGGILTVVDVSDIMQPEVLITATSHVYDAAGIVRFSQGLAFLSADAGIYIYDAANLGSLVPLALIQTSGSPSSVSVMGSYVFVTGVTSGDLRVYDISNPGQPILVADVAESLWSGTKTIIRGNLLYLINPWRGIRILDISNKTQIVELGATTTSFSAWNIVEVDSNILVADGSQGNSGFVAIGTSNPAQPMQLGRYYMTDFVNAESVTVANSTAYVVSGYSLIDIVDIHDISKPVKLGVFQTRRGHTKSASIGDYLLLGTFTSNGDTSLMALDISQKLSPTIASLLDMPSLPFNFELSGNLAYVAAWGEGLSVVDTSVPAALKQAGHVTGIGNVDNVAVSGNYAYLSYVSSGDLIIVNVANSSSPTLTRKMSTSIGSLAADDKYLYLHTHQGVEIYSLVDPEYPELIASSSDLSRITDFSSYDRVAPKIIGDYIVIAHKDAGLYIYEFSPPPSGSSVLSGQTIDNEGRPIPGVQVDLRNSLGTIASDYSGPTGLFSFTVSSPGQYTVSVDKSMYTFAPTSTQVSIPGPTVAVTFAGSLHSDFSPVVFVPGITGSYLKEQGGSEDLWPGHPGTDHSKLSNRPADQPAAIYAPDVIRADLLDLYPVYGPLIETLAEGQKEYLGWSPSQGCDLRQATNDPTLFVFPYDWRLSNAVTATKLQKYVDCIQQFYPGVKVNFVAHSMGGLVVRRYILDASKIGQDHHVRRLITIGTPWLGGPKFIDALETGDIGIETHIRTGLLWGTVRVLLEAFPGAHELLPSAKYFEFAQLSGSPEVLVERGWDINGNGVSRDVYTYDMLIDFVNDRYPKNETSCGEPTKADVCKVGSNNKEFHDELGQDVWSQRLDDIDYHYIVGIQRSNGTPAGYVATPVTTCIGRGLVRLCVITNQLVEVVTRGDGTVPLVSARRAPDLQMPDGNPAMIHRINSETQPELYSDDDADHLGMTKNSTVQELITNLLSDVPMIQTAATNDAVPAAVPAFYIRVFGTGSASVTNASGQVTGAISPTLILREASDVTYLPSSTGNFLVIVPTAGMYTVTFQSGDAPMLIEVTRQGDLPPDYAARWQDLAIPPGTVTQLLITPAGVQGLAVDSNGDSVPDAPVQQQPLVVQGVAAADTEAPNVQIQSLRTTGGYNVTIAATDTGAGVQSIYYALDGESFSPYTQPITISSQQPVTVTAFADDNVANRSIPVQITLVYSNSPLYLPYVSR